MVVNGMFDKLVLTNSEGAFILSIGAPYTIKRLMVVYDFWKPGIVFFLNETSFSVPIRARKYIYIYIYSPLVVQKNETTSWENTSSHELEPEEQASLVILHRTVYRRA